MRSSGRFRALAMRGTWNRAASGEMCGSRPEADVVTRSAGGEGGGVFVLRFFIFSRAPGGRALFGGPRVEGAGVGALVGGGGGLGGGVGVGGGGGGRGG